MALVHTAAPIRQPAEFVPDLARIKRLLSMDFHGDDRLLIMLRLRERESFEAIASILRISPKQCRERYAGILQREIAINARPIKNEEGKLTVNTDTVTGSKASRIKKRQPEPDYRDLVSWGPKVYIDEDEDDGSATRQSD